MSPQPRIHEIRTRERDVQLVVHDWGGDGPAVLCAHATGFCGRLWELVARSLGDRLRVLAVDQRGHGDSSAPDRPQAYAWSELAGDLVDVAEALCTQLGARRIDYAAGNSMGATCLIGAASLRPELFGQLALVDAALVDPDLVDLRRTQGSNYMAERAQQRRSLWPSRSAVREAYASRSLFADWLPEALDLYVEHGFRDRPDGSVELKCSPLIEAEVFSSATGFDLRAAVTRLRVPGTLMRARRGEFPPDLSRRVASLSDSLAWCEIDTGHLAPMSEPDALAEILIETFSGV